MNLVVGIPAEIKSGESRVALTAAGADLLARSGSRVLIERGAGVGSRIPDEAYAKAGAEIVDREEVFARADLIAKVKEPQPSEYGLLREGQVVFTYFHFAADRALTDAMLARGVVCIAYETVRTDDGSLPLLAPMSDVAGRLAVSAAMRFLEKPQGGKGKLLAPIPGVSPGRVAILGGGIAGASAAKIAAAMGAEVFVFDTDLRRLRFLFDVFPPNVHPLASNPYSIREVLPLADVAIGAVLIPGGRTPILISEEMLGLMEPGSVIVDIAVDQGGCVETARPTTHADPIFVRKGIVHYCVANMPGAVPQTSTLGLTNATLPYLVELASKGWRRALEENAALARGLNASEGKLRHPKVAEAFGLSWEPFGTGA